MLNNIKYNYLYFKNKYVNWIENGLNTFSRQDSSYPEFSFITKDKYQEVI